MSFDWSIILHWHLQWLLMGTGRFPGGSDGKASACNAGDSGSVPGSGRSSGEGNGNPLQYSCLEDSMDGEAWWAAVHGVAKSRPRLSDFTFLTAICCSFSSCFYTASPLLVEVSDLWLPTMGLTCDLRAVSGGWPHSLHYTSARTHGRFPDP